jgi:hypothetical protein
MARLVKRTRTEPSQYVIDGKEDDSFDGIRAF